MSPRNSVFQLKYICARFLSNLLIHLLSDDEGLNYETTREYLSDATYQVLQELLKNILNSINLDAATRFSSLEILLRKDVRKLETGIFPHSYYEKLLHVIRLNGKGLQQLNLKGVWVRDQPELLSELVNALNNLKVLVVPHMASDTVLECIARCEHLNVLDISGEASYTAKGLSYLKNENLQLIDIGNYGKKGVCEGNEDDTELISNLMCNLPNLRSIRTYSYTGLAVSLVSLQSRSHLNLTYLHDTGTTNEVFNSVIELCPALESIYLNSPGHGVISRLNCLRRLNCLKLTNPSLNELTFYVSNFASNLQTIKLCHNKREVFDLSTIALGIPRINNIECYQMHLSIKQPDVYFLFLNKIELLYCDISDDCLKLILSNSPVLKRVIIGCVINFKDGDVFRLCAECDFQYLEELWLSCAKNLTIMSVELLVGHCPNLKSIGQMTGWDVNNEEIEVFRYVMQISNTDLTLLPLN
ncbi:hypothetical protein WA026_014452 [Henosepilachna vigintioctopunctata]|uniref:Uncharacterized protein n=1 Tax=Henosepilachna vigintioctopunctata TaxID=420089 RepID=A0AAW1UJU6_9CUCU